MFNTEHQCSSGFYPGLAVEHIGLMPDKRMLACRQLASGITEIVLPTGNGDEKMHSLCTGIRADDKKMLLVSVMGGARGDQ